MSANFERIKKYYEKGYYEDSHMRVFVSEKVLTSTEYTKITGQVY